MDREMSLKVIVGLVCAVSICSGIPLAPAETIQIGDDKANWEAFLKEMPNKIDNVARSGEEDIFDRILRINAEERGSGVSRTDDNVFLYQGDVSMSKSDASNLVNRRSRKPRAVIRSRRNLWPRNVPYAIHGSLTSVRRNIEGAIREWQQALPCLGRWQDVSRTRKPRDYMYFFRGRGCYSRVGKVGGAQRISIGNGCHYHGVVVHEIGHAMGLWHEQSRPDRNSYVTILWNNIAPAMKFNFQKQSESRINSFGVSYDYASVMHYGSYAFSRYPGRKTIESKPAGKKLGQRNGLSYKDKQQVQLLYGCSTTVKPKPTVRPKAVCRKDLDDSGYCPHWESQGYCVKGQFVRFMKTNCCKTCAAGNTGVKQTCRRDLKNRIHCNYWKRREYCVKHYVSFMKKNCCKTCG